VEGSLVISLGLEAKKAEFQNLSFPLLREVTDYIMLYETAGIISMAKLFPNLSVIRGNHLFKDYALIISML